jgi:pimeloyl-ACP methyl ester carboxylesterase
MRTIVKTLGVLLCFGMGSLEAAEPAESKLVGVWQGTLEAGPMKLRIVFDIKSEGGDVVGTLDSPDQHAFGIPMSRIALEGGAVKIESQAIQGTFSGTLSADAGQIDGQWSQMGQSFPLLMRRGEKVQPARRPQEPAAPLPYDAEEVTYESGKDVRLAGTLTKPRGQGPFPAVLLISGSGPQDRDEALMGHKPFLVLADHLTRRGFAVLRVDDRGVGGSTGNLMQSTLQDFSQDTLAGVAFLRSRADIGPIGLIGHSEGGIVASLAANASREVAAVVLIASPGVRVDELLIQQMRKIGAASGLSEQMLVFSESFQRDIYAILRATPDADEVAAKIDALWAKRKAEMEGMPASDQAHVQAFEGTLQAQSKMVGTRWFRDLIDHDPSVALRQLRVPVLALFGELDMQVPVEHNAAALEKALRDAQNRDATIKTLPGLNHLMQTALTGLPTEYAMIDETFSPTALDAISAWLKARLQK